MPSVDKPAGHFLKKSSLLWAYPTYPHIESDSSGGRVHVLILTALTSRSGNWLS